MAALVVKINQIIKQIQKIFSDDLSVFNGKKINSIYTSYTHAYLWYEFNKSFVWLLWSINHKMSQTICSCLLICGFYKAELF